MNKQVNKQSGFTLTELSLSMAMLSVLLIIILLSIFNIVGMYNKGLTLKRVNQSGRAISAEVQSSLHKTSTTTDAESANVSFRTEQLGGKSVYTRLCTGYYTFIWNVYEKNGLGDDISTNETYSNGEKISLIRINDQGGRYCQPGVTDRPTKTSSSALLGDDLVLRLPVDIELGNPASGSPALGTTTKLVRFTFTLSTPDGSALDDSGSVCEGGSGNNFCALNTFVVTSYLKGI